MHPAYFYTPAFSFLLGVAGALLTPLSYWFAVLFGVIALAFAAAAVLFRSIGGDHVPLVVVLIACVALGLGVTRASMSEDALGSEVLEKYAGERVTLVGTVSDERDERADYARLELSARKVGASDGTSTISAGILVNAPRYPVYRYGDVLKVRGKLEKPGEFETETGRTFHYDTFLAKEGISYTVSYPQITRIGSGEGTLVISSIFDLKQAFLARINRIFQEPQSALAGGILLGTKQSLGERWETMFRDTGLIHIVVLSGYNVTVVAVAIMAVLSRAGLGIRARTVVGLAAIAVFAVMVGLGATVVRASIMAGLVVLARAIGRRFNIHRALVVAAAAMVMVNPLVLLYDPSFQLSFVATLGLVYVTPLIEPAFRWVPEKGRVFEIVTATISTQLAVLPLLLYMTGSFSLVAVPVNVLVLPIVAAAMFASFVAGALAFISSALAFPVTMAGHVLLSYIFRVVEWFAALPFAHVTLPPFPVWIPLGIYVLTTLFVSLYYYSFGFEQSSVMEQKIAATGA